MGEDVGDERVAPLVAQLVVDALHRLAPRRVVERCSHAGVHGVDQRRVGVADRPVDEVGDGLAGGNGELCEAPNVVQRGDRSQRVTGRHRGR